MMRTTSIYSKIEGGKQISKNAALLGSLLMVLKAWKNRAGGHFFHCGMRTKTGHPGC